MRDGLELSANLWRPSPRAGSPGRAVPRHPRDDPVREGQLAPELGHGVRRVAGRPRVRAVPARRPGHGQLARRRPRRVHRGRDPRRVRRRRVAGGPAVVQRQRRHVGHQLRRLHGDPGRQAPAAAPPRDPADVRDRRPLSRRRPPPRRLHHREREEPVRRQPAGHERAAAARRRSVATGWRDEWRARLEATPPWLFPWIREQTDGPYWRRGSLAPDYEALECAVFQVAGWSDAYVDPAFRIQERCVNADACGPSSATGSTRSRTTRTRARTSTGCASSSGSSTTTSSGVENGWERRAGADLVRARVGRGRRRSPRPGPADGGRRTPSRWPGRGRSSSCSTRTTSGDASARWLGWRPGPPAAVTGGSDTLRHRATVGTAGGLSWGAGWPPERPRARPPPRRGRRPDLHVRAASRADLRSSACPRSISALWTSMPVATCVVRLSDVAPDGTSSLVATGALNLTHRRSDTHPTPMPRGSPDGRAGPDPAAHERLPVRRRPPDPPDRPGGYWPVLWPSPFPGTMLRPPRRRHAVAAPPAGAPRRRAAACDRRPSRPPTAGRTARGRLVRRRRARMADRGGRARGTVSVTIYDGGASIAEDGSRVYSAERLGSPPRTPTRPTRAWQRRRLPLDGRRRRHRHPRDRA